MDANGERSGASGSGAFFLLTNDQTVTTTIATDSTRRNAKSGTASAAQTPSAEPITAGMLALNAHGHSIARCR